MKTADKIKLFGALAMVISAGLFGYSIDGETYTDVYTCEVRDLAWQCDSLSNVNSNGFQTRCYFFDEVKDRDTYKSCSSGWEKFNNNQVINNSDTVFVCEKKNKLIQECISEDDKTLIKVSYFYN